jgi:hypothetical protein
LIRYAAQFDNGASFNRMGLLPDTRLRDKKPRLSATPVSRRVVPGSTRRARPGNSSPLGASGYLGLERNNLMIDKRELLEAASDRPYFASYWSVTQN